MSNGVNNNRDNFRGDLYVIRGEQDPSSFATKGALGTIFIRVGLLGGTLYQKQDNGKTTNWTLFGGLSTDIRAKVSGADTSTDFLSLKLANGTGIASFVILNPGANEQLEITLDTVFTDGRYYTKTSFINTSTGAPDAGKPVVLNAGGLIDPTMLPPSGVDQLVKISATDTTTGFLGVKLANGTGIASFVILNPGANEQLEITLDTVFTDNRYYTKASFISVSTGAPDAGKPVVLNGSGLVDNSMLPASAFTDEFAKVSATDTTTGFLGVKLANGTGIASFVILNPAANEQLEISLDTVYTDNRYYTKASFISVSTGAPDAGKPVVLNGSGLVDNSMLPASAFTDEFAKVSATDTTTGFLAAKIVAGSLITLNVLNPAANEQLEIVVNESSIDHGALAGLGDDDHPQYVLKSTLTTKGDIFVRDVTNPTRLGVGTDGQILVADAAEAVGVKWANVNSVVAGQIDYSYGNNSNPYIFTGNATYLLAADLLFPGTTVFGVVSAIEAIIGSNDAVLGASFKIFDRTNALQIAEITGVISVPLVITDFGALTNVSAGPAVWELQMKRDSPGAQAQLSAITIIG